MVCLCTHLVEVVVGCQEAGERCVSTHLVEVIVGCQEAGEWCVCVLTWWRW